MTSVNNTLKLKIDNLGVFHMNSSNNVVGYARVSSTDQDNARQIESLTNYGVGKFFQEKASGKDTQRPVLMMALEYLREGDTFVIHSLDRLARNLVDLLNLVQDLTNKGITVKFLKENLTFTGNKDDHIATLTLSMLGAFAQFERSLIKERQLEGIAIAKEQGRFKGKPLRLSSAQAAKLIAEDRENHGKGRTALAAKYGMSRETLYRYLKRGAKE